MPIRDLGPIKKRWAIGEVALDLSGRRFKVTDVGMRYLRCEAEDNGEYCLLKVQLALRPEEVYSEKDRFAEILNAG